MEKGGGGGELTGKRQIIKLKKQRGLEPLIASFTLLLLTRWLTGYHIIYERLLQIV